MVALAVVWSIPERMAEVTAAKKEGRRKLKMTPLESRTPALLMYLLTLFWQVAQVKPTTEPMVRAAPGL